MEVNENPGLKVQILRLFYLGRGWLEEQSAREIPIITNSGQRNARTLLCLVGHANEIPQFHQFG